MPLLRKADSQSPTDARYLHGLLDGYAAEIQYWSQAGDKTKADPFKREMVDQVRAHAAAHPDSRAIKAALARAERLAK